MTRLREIDPDQAQGETKELLDDIQQRLGAVPNFLRVFANSAPTLAGFQGLHGELQRGMLEPKTRERIALAMAEKNGSPYCLSAHTALGAESGLDGGEIVAARRGRSQEARADAAVRFACSVLNKLGGVETAELEALRAAGYDDAEIVEIVGHVGFNLLGNIMGKVALVDIDFPEVALFGSATVRP